MQIYLISRALSKVENKDLRDDNEEDDHKYTELLGSLGGFQEKR